MGKTTFSGPVASQGGFIENSFTTAERDAIVNPVVGLMIYNTTTNTYQVYGNSGWQEAFGPAPSPAVTYTSGVDYTGPGVVWASANGTTGTIDMNETSWLNSGYATIAAKPSGTAFSLVDSMFGTVTGTLTSAFSYGAGHYVASVSFSPATFPTMGSGSSAVSITI